MEIQIGDRFLEGEFEWEVVTHHAAFQGGKPSREDSTSRLTRERDRDDLGRARQSADSADAMNPGQVERRRLDAELRRYAEAIAIGGPLPSLLEAISTRGRRRAELDEQLQRAGAPAGARAAP